MFVYQRVFYDPGFAEGAPKNINISSVCRFPQIMEEELGKTSSSNPAEKILRLEPRGRVSGHPSLPRQVDRLEGLRRCSRYTLW